MTNAVAEKKGPFAIAQNQQAYLKAGLLGFPGSGKTFTAALIAKGIHALRGRKPPVFGLDTEGGLDFLVSRFKEWSVPLYVSKSRAFVDLMDGVKTAEKEGAILIIDSITHFWMELQKAYKAQNRRDKLKFQDWGPIKETWGQFSDAFLNSRCDILMLGRAGFEYEYQDDDDGKKELIKTGTKMKAETDLGYEPSLLIEMVRERREAEKKGHAEGLLWDHVAYVLKDRSQNIEGKVFKNPTFESFKPHFDYLNIGGEHVGVDTSRDSKEVFKKDNEFNVVERRRQVEIVKEEIQGLLTSAFPGMSAEEKKAKVDLLEEAFKTRSWTALDEFAPETLREGLALIKKRAAEIIGGQKPKTKEGK